MYLIKAHDNNYYNMKYVTKFSISQSSIKVANNMFRVDATILKLGPVTLQFFGTEKDAKSYISKISNAIYASNGEAY